MADGDQDERDILCDSAKDDDKSVQPIVETPAQGDSAETIDRSEIEDAPAPTIIARGLVGSTIGQFEIVGIIGEGGMGCVYEAVQDKPSRTVALKVMKTGVTSDIALRRFELESQLLARLRHQGIAQVFDAGTWDEGYGTLPWFAMEYIPNAQEITTYAAQKNLSIRDRLKLFQHVCDAVHHGHQKGVIHRDLKPGNILVDSTGQPKIIDFGVARSTDSDLNAAKLQTIVGQLVGTLQYMSPEQCDADPHDIDIRSDVYALGVILYELICNNLPYDLSSSSIYEATRIIKEDPPLHPRHTQRKLPKDVETILLKALEKDRDRRYPSAQALGEDIRRFLEFETIIARPPSMTYQARMFCRRHRTVTAVSFVVFLLIAVGVPLQVKALGDAELAEAQQLAAEHLVIVEHNRRIEEVHELVGLVARLEEDIRHLPSSEVIRAVLLNRIIERLNIISTQTDQDPIVMEQLAMAWERLANLPPPQDDPNVYLERLSAWDEAISIRSTLDDLLSLTGTRYSLGVYGLSIAMNETVEPAIRLQAANRAKKEFEWCRDNGDYELLSNTPEPYRELLSEEIASCDAEIALIRESFINP